MLAMWRFIVGLLATVGFLALLAIGGGVAFVTSGPFASKALPSSMVLSLDLRTVPPETIGSDLLHGNLWRSSRDIADTVQLLWQPADHPPLVGFYVQVVDHSPDLPAVQLLRPAHPPLRAHPT